MAQVVMALDFSAMENFDFNNVVTQWFSFPVFECCIQGCNELAEILSTGPRLGRRRSVFQA